MDASRDEWKPRRLGKREWSRELGMVLSRSPIRGGGVRLGVLGLVFDDWMEDGGGVVVAFT